MMQRSPSARHFTVCAAVLVFAILYSLFLFLYTSFPYLESGADLVTRLKHGLASNGRFFKTSQGVRIMVFGNSKILTGFIPSLFDSELAAAGFPGVESWNFGLPGDSRFVADLETMAARGTAPDVVLLTVPWPATSEPGPTFFHFVDHDQEIMGRLFPFRKILRDFFIMSIEAHGSPGAFKRIYSQSERTVKKVEADCGYYFIARQSHYRDDELPPDLRVPTDTPNTTDPRSIPHGPVFVHLVSLFKAHNIRCLFIPTYFREGQLAPAASLNTDATGTLAGQPNMGVAGPDYYLYPNRHFSDITHVNPNGAKIYTRDIAALVAAWLKERGPAR
jgi:hypothetical protein